MDVDVEEDVDGDVDVDEEGREHLVLTCGFSHVFGVRLLWVSLILGREAVAYSSSLKFKLEQRV